jgi:hypothetical protein
MCTQEISISHYPALSKSALSTRIPILMHSHTLGGLGEPRSITLNDHTLEITRNLEQALLHLRRCDKAIYLWVDALSINQNDNEEKSYQVGIIGQIYRGAAHVRAWIGPMEDNNTTGSNNGQSTESFETHTWDVWELLEVFGTSHKFHCWDEKLPHKLKKGPARTELVRPHTIPFVLMFLQDISSHIWQKAGAMNLVNERGGQWRNY